jgi:aryl-alcohol dehydrogenase-like predicted oxidoreductase
MEYRNMGRTGLKVSELALGTMTFGHGTDEATAKRMVNMALDAGVNHVDTANSYSGGESEIMLGKALQGRRSKVVLATKFTNPVGPGPNDSGMSRVHIMNAVEDCLHRLDTDWIDILYIHHLDEETPLEEALRALDDLVHQGKIRYIANSNYEAWRLSEACWLSEANRWHRFEAYQAQYSLVVRDIEDELVPLCLHKGLGIMAWSPLGGGYLTGKYRPGQQNLAGTRSAEGWAFAPARSYASPKADEIVATLLDVAEETGRSPAQLALRWVAEQPGVASVIVGARTMAQLEDNLQASAFRLDEGVAAQLGAVSQPRDRYPKAMESGSKAKRAAAVKLPSL